MKRRTLIGLAVGGGALVLVGLGAAHAVGQRGHGWGHHGDGWGRHGGPGMAMDMEMGGEHGMGMGMGPGLGLGIGPHRGHGPGRAGLDGLCEAGVRAGLADMDEALKAGGLSWEAFAAKRQGCFASLDKSADGGIDQAELETALEAPFALMTKRILKRLDTDKDGKVSKAELLAPAKEHFADRDLNSDGRIGPEDLPPGAGERRHRRWGGDEPMTLETLTKRHEERFARLDKNSDGFLDAAELEGERDAEGNVYRIRVLLHRFDADRDGKVTLEEFNRRAKQRFAENDLNDDGKLTLEELPARLRKRIGD